MRKQSVLMKSYKVILNLLRFKGVPGDVPYSIEGLAVLMFCNFFIDAVVFSAQFESGGVLAAVAVLLWKLLYTYFVFKSVNKLNRYVQVMTCILGATFFIEAIVYALAGIVLSIQFAQILSIIAFIWQYSVLAYIFQHSTPYGWKGSNLIALGLLLSTVLVAFLGNI